MVISYTKNVLKILNYKTRVVSTIWASSDTDWVDITNYELYMKDPSVGNVIELTTTLQTGNDKHEANMWFRWKLTTSNADGTSPTVTYVENNSLPNITVGNRFRSAFGAQLPADNESAYSICNTSFHVVNVLRQSHVFQLQCKINDGGAFTINSLHNNENKVWNSYMTSRVTGKEVSGLSRNKITDGLIKYLS